MTESLVRASTEENVSSPVETQTKTTLLAGSFWVSITEAVVFLIDMGRQLVTVRVLLQSDIGLMARAMICVTVIDILTKTGFEQALIQRRHGVEQLMNVAWTWQIIRGIVLAVVLASAAPFLAVAFKQPLLKPLLWVTCIHAFLPGLQNVGLLYYSRQSDFKTLFLLNSLSPLVRALVVIPLVLIRKDVWALLIGLIAATLTWVIVSYAAHPYRPRLEWNLDKSRELFRFGKWITGLSIMMLVVTQGDMVFVSTLGEVQLALYAFAIDMAVQPTAKVAAVIGTVSFPAYSRLQGKPKETKALFDDAVRSAMLIAGPVTVFLFAIAPDFVQYVVTSRWEPAIPLVRVLVFAGFVRAFVAVAGPLFQGSGRADLDFKMSLARMLATVTLIWPANYLWGLKGVAFVAVAAVLTCLPTWFFGVHKIVKMSPWYVIRANKLAWIATGTLALAYWLSRRYIGGTLGLDILCNISALGLWTGMLWTLGRLTPLNVFKEIQRLRTSLKSR